MNSPWLPAIATLLLAVLVVLAGRAEAVDRRLGAGIAKPAPTGAPWTPEEAGRLARDLDALLSGAPTLRGAHVGLFAIDTRSGAVLYARNADDAFQPASTLKLLTGSVALATLGPEYRFRTQALLDAANAKLYVHAGGDPLLAAADLNAMAQSVRASGIVALPSGVGIDASDFDSTPYPPGWTWDDFAYDYAPVVSAASVEENVVHLTIAPGAATGAHVLVTAAPPPFGHVYNGRLFEGCPLTHEVVLMSLAETSERGSADTLDIGRESGGCIAVTGALPLGAEPEAIDAAVPSPVWYMRELTYFALKMAGIDAIRLEVVAGSAEASDGATMTPADARVVWTHDGEPLSDLLADMWWPSDNLVAELLLKAVGRQARGVPGTTANGVDVERAWLAGIGVDPVSVTIADGSGLSSYDRITPRALAAILQADWNGPFRDIVLDDLPLAGVRGTLAKSFIGSLAERRTFAKTGSFNHTRALAGYLATIRHGAVTFVWNVDDWMGTDADLNALRVRVLARLIGD
jgi:D-alanyl-D-alanine carboxypeptidase/D-alanyl-D-alanine-endopeptidase (penicillin-binding protein 4)